MKQSLQKYDKRDNFHSVNFPLVGDVTRRPSNDVYASLIICFDIGSSNVIDFNGRKIFECFSCSHEAPIKYLKLDSPARN